MFVFSANNDLLKGTAGAALRADIHSGELNGVVAFSILCYSGYITSQWHNNGWAGKDNHMSEKEVFVQDVSDEEMEAVAGGEGRNEDNCNKEFRRDMYAGGFPNCAATVEHNSWCGSSDACFNDAVCYYDMKECTKSWH